MKSKTHKNLLLAVAFSVAIISGFTAHAQYPAVSALLSNNAMGHYSINSTEDYLYVEQSINTLAAKIRDAYQKYPNVNYSPVYDNGEIIAFMINGVSKSSAADELSSNLMQLEVLGNAVRTMDVSYVPYASSKKLSRVSRKEASR